MLGKLIERQRALGLSDADFARLVELPRSSWQATRSGDLPLAPRVVRAALRVWPDLAGAALEWLRGESQEVSA